MSSRNRARALYLQPAPLFGGAERQAALSAALLPRHGVGVVSVAGPGDSISLWMREHGAERFVHTPHFPGGWPKQRGLSRLTLPFRYIACGLRLRALLLTLIRNDPVSIIVASLPFAWIVGSIVARKARIPVVWRAGGARINVVQKAGVWLLTRFLRPTLLLCTSESVLRTFGPLVPSQARVILNGVDPVRFSPSSGNARRYRPEGATLVIGYAARLTRAKRPMDFVELAARLRAKFPSARFLLAGEGTHRVELEARARAIGLTNLTFTGFVSDMPSFYAACDVVVCPSQSEGCPNFLLEAMAMAKPIVAADVAPVLELVRPGEDGLVYPVGNVDELTSQVSLLLREPDARLQFARRARMRALEFTADGNAARLAATLKELLADEPVSVASQRVVHEARGRDSALTGRSEAE